jgi:hypothetical protein
MNPPRDAATARDGTRHFNGLRDSPHPIGRTRTTRGDHRSTDLAEIRAPSARTDRSSRVQRNGVLTDTVKARVRVTSRARVRGRVRETTPCSFGKDSLDSRTDSQSTVPHRLRCSFPAARRTRPAAASTTRSTPGAGTTCPGAGGGTTCPSAPGARTTASRARGERRLASAGRLGSTRLLRARRADARAGLRTCPLRARAGL